MIRIHLRQPLAKTLLLFCLLCLIVPAVNAAENFQNGKPAPALQQTGSTPNASASDEAQKLSADELAELSARAEEPGSDVVGGSLNNTQLTYIVIALATAVIVLIAK